MRIYRHLRAALIGGGVVPPDPGSTRITAIGDTRTTSTGDIRVIA